MHIISWDLSAIKNHINEHERAIKIVNLINDLNRDIVCLQGVFHKNLKYFIIDNLINYTCFYSYPRKLIGDRGGLITAIKKPIKCVMNETYTYKTRGGTDYFKNKGILKVVINLENENGLFSIYNTQLQSNKQQCCGFTKYNKIHSKQLEELYDYISHDDNQKIICGGFNTNYLKIMSIMRNYPLFVDLAFPTTILGETIDFIFVLPIYAYLSKYSIIKIEDLSEHYIVSMDLFMSYGG